MNLTELMEAIERELDTTLARIEDLMTEFENEVYDSGFEDGKKEAEKEEA